MSEETKLLPCPMCGSLPDVYDDTPTNRDGCYKVRCGTCGIQTDFQTDAIAAWNRRPKPRTNFEKWRDDLTVGGFRSMISYFGCSHCRIGRSNCEYKWNSVECIKSVQQWANAEVSDD